MHINQLLNEIINLKNPIDYYVRHYPIPEDVVHMFALESAKAFLQHARRNGIFTDVRFKSVLNAKERWIFGLIDEHERHEWETVAMLVLGTIPGRTPSALKASIQNIMSTDRNQVISGVLLKLPREDEPDSRGIIRVQRNYMTIEETKRAIKAVIWQHRLFADLFKNRPWHKKARQDLLSVLKEIEKSKDETIDIYVDQLEDILFSF